jgi:GT2 family glycosyltransferase
VTGPVRRPGVTVVVPTWNRPLGLRRALEGLARQQLPGPEWDVTVVASAGDPAARPVVEAVAGRLAVPVTVADEPEPGASRARNRGVETSRRVVAFLDDDCVPEPGWLAAITGPVLAGGWAAAGGKVVADPSVARPRWLGDALVAYLAEYDRGPEEHPLAGEDFLLTANAAFDADLLTAAGGFDPLLGPTAGRPTVNDDVDVCRKVRAAGGRILYVPAAVVVHELPVARLSPSYLLRRMHAQGRSDWILERRTFGAGRDRGLGAAGRQLAGELSSILRQGPWHRPVALHAAGSLARAAGFAREALRPRARQPD